jgi:hypothetical protein
MVVGVTRAVRRTVPCGCARHDDDQSVVGGSDLVPELIALLGATLEPETDEETP